MYAVDSSDSTVIATSCAGVPTMGAGAGYGPRPPGPPMTGDALSHLLRLM